MRISDWSSDVCSSDSQRSASRPCVRHRRHSSGSQRILREMFSVFRDSYAHLYCGRSAGDRRQASSYFFLRFGRYRFAVRKILRVERFQKAERRSEEHTSELQSLMRNSYAVFCLKKKKNKITNDRTIRQDRYRTRIG